MEWSVRLTGFDTVIERSTQKCTVWDLDRENIYTVHSEWRKTFVQFSESTLRGEYLGGDVSSTWLSLSLSLIMEYTDTHGHIHADSCA